MRDEADELAEALIALQRVCDQIGDEFGGALRHLSEQLREAKGAFELPSIDPGAVKQIEAAFKKAERFRTSVDPVERDGAEALLGLNPSWREAAAILRTMQARNRPRVQLGRGRPRDPGSNRSYYRRWLAAWRAAHPGRDPTEDDLLQLADEVIRQGLSDATAEHIVTEIKRAAGL